MRSRAAPARQAGRQLHEVPLLARAVLVACVTLLTSAFFGESGTGLYRVLRFLPGAGRDFVTDLQAFSVKATSVSGTATFFFLATSLNTFFQVESAVQALWGSTLTPRRPLRRLGTALSVMILGPIALGVLTSILLESGAPLGDFRPLGSLMSFGLLTYLYRKLPGSVSYTHL